ncbi:helix-turn-helix domain-containing protein [Planctomicrobium sp. SH668]|uniref:helix-turn-helix domain-containing protein n=1 Tax=Planctomicrobium sp. SH668 TaxID=3448126 RepID=UPI003F5C60E6
MEKSIYTDEYSVLLELLAALRQKSGITQVELAQLLGQSQSFISKVERGDRRLDVIQLRTIVQTLGSTLPEFVSALEKQLRGPKK